MAALALTKLDTVSAKVADASVYQTPLQVENTPLRTTGGHTWPAARALFEFIAKTDGLGLADFLRSRSRMEEDGRHGEEQAAITSEYISKDLNILELGSGCGWVALNLAYSSLVAGGRYSGRQSLRLAITTSEQPGKACEWLQHNIERHAETLATLASKASLFTTNTDTSTDISSTSCSSSPPPVVAVPLDWQNPDLSFLEDLEGDDHKEANLNSSSSKKLDFLIGSDLIYNEIGSRCLPKIVKSLLEQTGASHFLYSHTFHRYDHLDKEFLEVCEAEGLQARELETMYRKLDFGGRIVEHEVPIQEEFEQEIFPEKRIAILKITLAKADNSLGVEAAGGA
ncbi:unnamed protein product [Amoebophrya sp. A25]|nr:unnamed protein product [Amoebophrya sp. A25]|eukprot:GSA25T00021968001.1